ncbi:hypothetical protein LJ754_01475 [Arthrobacter sp. zg-Y40]|uniref:hypothetical protein n=1 Tax=unclassified Arthrobacter TaxID=235627 RepID=UPI001D14176A|nr:MULTISPECIES: hypothetical protein [unclassified Arthrobacter]MCC3277833.1 hypothetical protein [Arthrobacter sp. zg-Y40]MDK1327071.1 hypothetical protein [Arthrobacter sp. zg-Y1143]
MDHVDGRALEYVVEYNHTDGKTGLVSRRPVKLDGYYWEKGPPPTQVYQEGKGRYEWMETSFKDATVYRSTLTNMAEGQFKNQVDMLIQSGGNTRLEWHFQEQKVADDFFDLIALDPRFRSLVDQGRIVIQWTPMP